MCTNIDENQPIANITPIFDNTGENHEGFFHLTAQIFFRLTSYLFPLP